MARCTIQIRVKNARRPDIISLCNNTSTQCAWRIFDLETNSTWDIVRGLATDGELREQALQSLPSMTAIEDHWLDFYPNSTFWEGGINNE